MKVHRPALTQTHFPTLSLHHMFLMEMRTCLLSMPVSLYWNSWATGLNRNTHFNRCSYLMLSLINLQPTPLNDGQGV